MKGKATKKDFVIFGIVMVLAVSLILIGTNINTYHEVKYSFYQGCTPDFHKGLAYCNPLNLGNGTWIDTTTNPLEKYLK